MARHPPEPPLTDPPGAGSTQPGSLLRDPWLSILLGALLVVCAPYFLPGLDPVLVARLGEQYGLLPVLFALLGAILAGVRALPRAGERRFWLLLATAFSLNLAIRIAYLMPSLGETRGHVAVDLTYVLFYFALILAFHSRPDEEEVGIDNGVPVIETLATAVFLVGLLVYFVLVPEAVSPGDYETWVPSMLLYWTLDGYLLFTLLHLHQSSSSERWRILYAWLAIAALGWAATDLYEALYYIGWVEWVDEASGWNSAWYVPYVLFGVAARLRLVPVPAVFARPGVRPEPSASRPGRVGISVVYALVLLTLHLASNLTGLIDQASRESRELTVLVSLPVLLGLAYLHQRMLVRRAERLEAVSRELAEQRVLLNAAVEQATISVMVARSDGRVAYVNPAWEATRSQSAGELVGRPTGEVLRELGDEAVELWGEARSEGVAAGRTSWSGPDGKRFVGHLSISPVRSPAGGVTHHALSLRDVTHEVLLEHQLHQAQRMEALGTLSGGIAHDFNNILAAVLGYSELLKERLADDREASEDLEKILQATERARALTAQILTFSRQEETERAHVRLGEIVEEALKLIRPTVPTSIDVRTRVDTASGPIHAEEGRIHQVVVNLATNAVQAMGERGVLEVAVAEEELSADDVVDAPSLDLEPGRYAVLTVSDDGTGMDAETLDRMYDPFFTTKRLGHGTGLGLSVVHGIVVTHGGGIAVDSQPGRGTTFRVFLPVATLVPEECAAEGRALHGGTPEEHVLIVDDERSVAEVLSRGLRLSGFRVTVAGGPADALHRFRQDPRGYSAVLTDQTMPGMTGLELARAVTAARPKVPVLLMTGYSEAVTPERVAKDGVAEVLLKPISRADLVAAIRRHLDGGARRRLEGVA